QDDVDGNLALARGLKQQLDEGRGVVVRARGVARGAEAEQLLELVYDDEQLLVLREPPLARGLSESERAAPERRLDDGLRFGARQAAAGLVEHAVRGERAREVADGVVAGPHDGDAPARARAGHHAA